MQSDLFKIAVWSLLLPKNLLEHNLLNKLAVSAALLPFTMTTWHSEYFQHS